MSHLGWPIDDGIPMKQGDFSDKMPDEKTIQFAEYILNHYARDSRKDYICLARRLEKWAKDGK